MVKRILIVSGNYPPHAVGGGEITTRIMAEWFAANGVAVHVVACVDAGAEEIKIENGLTVEFVRSPNIYWWHFSSPPRSLLKKAIWHILENYNPRTVRLLENQIQSFRPDVVLTCVLENFGASAWLAGRRLGVPTVHVIHSHYPQCLKALRWRDGKICEARCLRCRLGTAGKKISSRFVDGVIGVSRYILETHVAEGYFPNAEKKYIYNPVEQCADLPRAARKSQPPSYGFLSRLYPIKGIEELIRIFSSGAVNGRLIIAGTGDPEYESKLRTSANPAFVEFLGWVDPAVLFQRIDFLIYPSILNEPFGRGIVEAMSQGVPAIGARRGGIPEVIDHGRNGFLYDPDVAGQLEQITELARTADYAELSQNALRTSEAFLKPVIMRKYIEFLTTVINDRSNSKDAVTSWATNWDPGGSGK